MTINDLRDRVTIQRASHSFDAETQEQVITWADLESRYASVEELSSGEAEPFGGANAHRTERRYRITMRTFEDLRQSDRIIFRSRVLNISSIIHVDMRRWCVVEAAETGGD